ncbi:MAG: hypothetical protein ACRELY_14880 [Polyangiaceae bacterium]
MIERLESGEVSVEDVARRHDLHAKTVRWWRARLRSEHRHEKMALVPVRVSGVARSSIRVISGEVIVELDAQCSLGDVASLVRALRA